MCAFADEDERERALGQARALAERGFRVLALAEGARAEPADPGASPPEPTGLELAGFLGMIDPLRAGVREAVSACHAAGIRTIP